MSLHIDTPFEKESSLKFNMWTNEDKKWHMQTLLRCREKKQSKEEEYTLYMLY